MLPERSRQNVVGGWFVVAVSVAWLLSDPLAVVYAEPPSDGIRLIDTSLVLFFAGLAHLVYAIAIAPRVAFANGAVCIVNPLRIYRFPATAVNDVGGASWGYPLLLASGRHVRLFAFELSNLQTMSGNNIYSERLTKALAVERSPEAHLEPCIRWRRPSLLELLLAMAVPVYLAAAALRWGLDLLAYAP